MIGVSPNSGILHQTQLPFARSSAMQMAVKQLQAVLRTDESVVITGEVGTGRELMARAIHRASVDCRAGIAELLHENTRSFRGDRPFVAVDCGAPNLEATLFGEPAATGQHQGDFDAISAESSLHRAAGGTLFLRQLQEMPARHQVRLARLLRDGEAWVSGGRDHPMLSPVRARIIASIEPIHGALDTRVNQELRKRFATGAIHVPPLRERREDIPGLVRHFLHDICVAVNVPPKSASRQAMALLSALPWRGNIQELKGLLEAIAARAPYRIVRLMDVLEHVRLDGADVAFTGGTLKEARERFEREYISAVLRQHRWRMAEAAKVLGIQRTNLYRKVRQLAVQRPGIGRQFDA